MDQYAHAVATGLVRTLRTYALLCARNFEACLSMQELPRLAPATLTVALDLEPYDRAITEADAYRDRLRARSVTQREMAYDDAYRVWQQHERRQKDLRKRLTRMHDAAQAWTPPSPEHVVLKDFMLRRLETALTALPVRAPFPRTAARWAVLQRRQADAACAQARRRRHEALRHAARATAWLQALADTLPEDTIP